MLELRHNKENGGEFLTKEQTAEQLCTHKYIAFSSCYIFNPYSDK